MQTLNKRKFFFPLFITILASGALSRSPALKAMRVVDMLLLFIAGMGAGIALNSFRSESNTDTSRP